MNPASKENWPHSDGSPQSGPPATHEQQAQMSQQQQRPLPGFGSNNPPQLGSAGQPGPVLPPPQGPYYAPGQPGGHSIPMLAGLQQGSPPQHTQGLPPQAQQSAVPQQQQNSAQSYALPAINQPGSHPQAPSTIDREREMRERDIRERQDRDRQRLHEEAVQRDREREQREQRDRHRIENQPQQLHQNHAGSLPMHQPVASKAPAMLGPRGILTMHDGASTNSSGPLGVPPGPGNVFGGPLPNEGGPPQAQQLPNQGPQAQMIGYGAGPGNLSMPANSVGATQGQQPILNDALSYLDQVKVQFMEHPDVYNRFLDIMKDFKSQAIDTPGVIDRVSTLFNGHPNLIQGFNTFLPPGYRIECGTGDNSHTIRVTTPSGTSNLTVSGGVTRATNGSWPNHAAPQGPAIQEYSPSGRVPGPPFNPLSAPHGPGVSFDNNHGQQAAIMSQHQQEQRGVSQLQNAVTAAANEPGRQGIESTPPNAGQTQIGLASANGAGTSFLQAVQGGQPGAEKRGPVEFNHAISYVNKIKNRFAAHPEIYKQFLEILQTYQREAKPIQDVYAQVTQLFNSAPDLLEDFKQFLPESAAQAKAQAAARQAAEDASILSNVRGGDQIYPPGSQATQSQHAPSQRTDMKMPPVGNFAPPSTAAAKDAKKKRGPGGQGAPSSSSQAGLGASDTIGASGGAHLNRGGTMMQGGNAAKVNRTKLHHQKPAIVEQPMVEPTLTPALPSPLPPTTSQSASSEEIAFFDRVKKFIGNKQVFNEFLKLCNLFSQDLIDKSVLVAKVADFIGNNVDLLNWFKQWVMYMGKDEVIENKARVATGRVSLSNCRALGPSYRLLPKRERYKKCSGRDDLCNSVLNDEWASHPTWASEDSGFIAHRKNTYEEQLHKIEEERHDYSLNIESAARAIQLLEPIVQQIAVMTDDERASFLLPPHFGGQTGTTIFERVVKKVYGREIGLQVIQEMQMRPCGIVPIVLSRIKMKEEEWKAAQREWNKVWREQTSKIFYKSLDHMGLNAKSLDKKQFQPKQLLAEILAKQAEQSRARSIPYTFVPKHQFEYSFDDGNVIADAARLMYVFASHHMGNGDKQKVEVFIKEFIPIFFGLSIERFADNVTNLSHRSPTDEVVEVQTPSGDTNSTRGRRSGKDDLLRGVLERGRNGRPSHNLRDASVASESQDSTPDAAAASDEQMQLGSSGNEEGSGAVQLQPDNWLRHPEAASATRGRPLNRPIPPYQQFPREIYSLYCNTNVYTFFRLFQALYERLLLVKQNEAEVAEDVRRAKMHKPAHTLKMLPFKPEDYFENTGPNANYYHQILDICEGVLDTTIEPVHFEEALRYYYMHSGWKLYTVDKLIGAIVRSATAIVSGEPKDKSNDVIQLFLKDREKDTTTHRNEITYRKQVEKLVKEGEVFRIAFNQPARTVTIQILAKEDTTFEDAGMTPEQRWSYYTASYISRQPTEGIRTEKLTHPFLLKTRAIELDDDEDPRLEPVSHDEGLNLRICVNSYKMLYDSNTADWFVHSPEIQSGGKEGIVEAKRAHEKRDARFEEIFVSNSPAAKKLSKDEFDQDNEIFAKWTGTERDLPMAGTSGNEDAVMLDA